MALNKAQLMESPGGPGVTGAVKAGAGISISADGTVSINPATQITKVVAGTNITLTPSTGVGEVTISASGGGGGGGDIPAGSVMIFYQAAAPTGWTRNTSINNSAIRLVSSGGGSTGGSQDFTSSFASYTPGGSVSLSGLSASGNTDNTSLSTNQLASHAHDTRFSILKVQGSPNIDVAVPDSGGSLNAGSSSTGGNGGHSHGVNLNVNGNASFNGSNTSQFAVKYADFLIATKN